MGVIKELKEKGLDADLALLFDKFVTSKGDSDSRNQLSKSLDETGLKSPKTMQLVGLLQRTGKLQPGLYKELVGLNKRLEEDNSVAIKPQEETKDSSAAKVKTHSGEKAMTEEKTDNVVHLEGFALTEKDKEKIKAKLQKEEEKIRQRLLKWEQKQVERAKARVEKRAQRQGMKIEEMQEIKERKEKLAVIREEMKERKIIAKKLKEEIKALRPKREKKEKKEGEAKAEHHEKKEKKTA
jgi:cell division cycle 2-like protein